MDWLLNSSSFVMRLFQHLGVAASVCVMALVSSCGDDTPASPPEVEPAPISEELASDPMSIIPDDVVLWEAFDAKRILKQPDTNTLVVEGTLAGETAALAGELETMAKDAGWSTEALTDHEGLSTLIMSKGSRRLKVNLTQDGDTVSVYLTTRLPE